MNIGICFQKRQQKHAWVCKGRGYLGLVAGMRYSPTLYGFVKLETGGVGDYCLVTYPDSAFWFGHETESTCIDQLRRKCLSHEYHYLPFGGQNYQWSEECAQLNKRSSQCTSISIASLSSTRRTMTIDNFDHQNGG